MAIIPEEVQDVVIKFVEKLKKEIPVEKVILFGSYVTGNYDDGSDIDLAIFSDYFEGMKRVDSITYLIIRATEYNLDLEPIAFTVREYREKEGIVAEILRTGIEVA
jgi:predicted nucleotidyltransferase